jgi:hypothetical protein
VTPAIRVWRTPGGSALQQKIAELPGASFFSAAVRKKFPPTETAGRLIALSGCDQRNRDVQTHPFRQPGWAMKPDLATLRIIRCSAAHRLIACFHDFCLWFSLPLAVWLSSGWIGLVLHWQAGLNMACWLGKSLQIEGD